MLRECDQNRRPPWHADRNWHLYEVATMAFFSDVCVLHKECWSIISALLLPVRFVHLSVIVAAENIAPNVAT